jgi:hypothetical protein
MGDIASRWCCMKDTRGSITIEAAIAFPVFLCVIISIIYLIRVVQINESISYAINGAANEIASASYLYHISSMEETNKLSAHAIEDMVEDFIAGIEESNPDKNADIEDDWIDNADSFPENHNNSGVKDDFPEQLKTYGINMLKGTFEDLKTDIYIPVTKLYIKKYLPDISLEKLDFSHSSFFEEDTGEIDIIVRYKIGIPVPIKIFPEIIIAQRAAVKAWLGGDSEEKEAGAGKTDNIWSLSNFERGRKIRDIFGANLPYNFPVLSKFEEGKATVIKSMDITAETYQNPEIVIRKINEYIDNLAQYKGQEIPWGNSKIVIMEKDIKVKELLLIIPSNEINQETESALELCILQGAKKGVVLNIKKYEYKEVAGFPPSLQMAGTELVFRR